MLRKIINFAMFQIGWFACVLGGAHGMPVAAIAAAGTVISVSLGWFSTDRMSDVRLFLAVALIGFIVDTVHLNFGVFALIGAPRFPYLCPLWLVALWAMFGTTLRGSLSCLAGRTGLAALLGAVAGPMSYWGGAKLGAVTLHPNRVFSLAALAVGKKIYNVKFDDWMFLMDDEVMLNRAVMSKWGIRLGEVTLGFRKLRAK